MQKNKAEQHDFKKHISAFKSVAEEENKRDPLQEDYKNYLLQDTEYKKLVVGGHPLFTGFLNNKIKEIESYDIEFQYEIAYTECQGLCAYEWIEVAGILLDNAIEALMGQQEDKKIYDFLARNNNIVLSFANISRYIGNNENSRFFRSGYSSKGKTEGLALPRSGKL